MSDHSTDEPIDPDEQRRAVRERYGAIAETSSGCCGPTADRAASGSSTGCCEPTAGERSDPATSALAETTRQLGYDDADLDAVEDGANLGLGCGNPTAIASLDAGETVLDLGAGAGFDCFLAAREVGETGHVIGVDMTPEMIEKARENSRENRSANTEFRLGEIEHLPVADGTVDVIISNCVINLSPAKPQVFAEAFRVLQPGGRLAVSDVVLSASPPEAVQSDLDAIASCVGGAATVEALETMLEAAGFVGIEIEPKDESREFIREWSDEYDVSEYAVSATIEARKPLT
ncbi:arsenite methyltransferase [Halohasta litorea]|uniref:Arsenite methyltransferase n=1 Tax=Halohasta litorea TaxID=869891 RepID=A0ABD6D8A5_9EURY|nr:arsenite methyltransferase [Halohasta litorea]